MVHLHIHLDVRASCNDGLEQIAPLVLSPKTNRHARGARTSALPRQQPSRRARRTTGSPRLSGSHAARGRRHPPRYCFPDGIGRTPQAKSDRPASADRAIASRGTRSCRSGHPDDSFFVRTRHPRAIARARKEGQAPTGADDCVVTEKRVRLLNVDRSLTDDLARWLAPTDLRPAVVPAPLVGLVHAVAAARPEELSRNDPVPDTAAERQAAVLILIATDRADGPDVLLAAAGAQAPRPRRRGRFSRRCA